MMLVLATLQFISNTVDTGVLARGNRPTIQDLPGKVGIKEKSPKISGWFGSFTLG